MLSLQGKRREKEIAGKVGVLKEEKAFTINYIVFNHNVFSTEAHPVDKYMYSNNILYYRYLRHSCLKSHDLPF